MAAARRARVVWADGLAKGSCRLTVESGALSESEVTWASLTERSEGKTSPDELIAAAHASSFAMALSHALDEAGAAPERLEVSAASTFGQTGKGFRIHSMELQVHVRLPDIVLDDRHFQDLVNEVARACPVSNALRGNVDVSVEAHLQ